MEWLATFVLRKIQKVLLVGTLASFGFGVHGVWHGWRNATPSIVTLSTDEPLQLPKHVNLRNVALDPAEVVAWEDFRQTSAYLPIRPRSGMSGEKIRFVLKTDDSALIEFATRARRREQRSISVRPALDVAQRVATRAEITGLIVADLNVSRRLKSVLGHRFPNLEREFQVIEEGASPSVWRGIALIALSGGLFALLGLTNFATGKKPATPAAEGGEQPPVLSRR